MMKFDLYLAGETISVPANDFREGAVLDLLERPDGSQSERTWP